jgi:hypothetical protein
MKLRDIMRRDGILTRWVGGPLDGRLIKVPSLDDVLTIHPEDNQGRPGGASRLRQVHRYVLTARVTLNGIPTYQYVGAENDASNS